MGYIKSLKVGVPIVFTLISTYVGTKLYTVDAKEGMDYFVPFVIFVVGYLIIGFGYIIVRAYQRKSVKALTIQVLISLAPLFLIPYGFIWKKSQENQVAVKEMEKKRYQKYLIELERINSTIREYPDSSILYVKRAQLKRSQGLYEESIADCQISLKKMESTDAYWEQGWCQEYLGHLEEALASYRRAALIDSSLDWPQKRIEVVERKIRKSL